jgi:hypothetical protein
MSNVSGSECHPLRAPAFAAAAAIAAANAGLQDRGRNIGRRSGGGCCVDTAAEFIEADPAQFHRPFRQDCRQLGTRRFGFDPLRRATRPHLRRIDAAQAYQSGNRYARPYLHTRLEGIAVGNAQNLGGINTTAKSGGGGGNGRGDFHIGG